jgi:hypothetical protein
MIGRRNSQADIRRAAGVIPGPRRSMCAGRPSIAATALLFDLALQCLDLRAELVFRSAEQIDGRQQWSAPRNYANLADTVYPRARADGRQRIAGNTVSLSGNGGDVDAAMELGRVLRRLGVSTLVARGSQCLSSCVFAFMGGDRRSVAGRIGIHRPYFSSTRKVPDRPAYYRRLQQRLQHYFEELDFPRSLYEALMAVPPESMSILTAADLKKFYLQGMSPSTEDEADATAAGNLGISVQQYLQRKAQAEPCAGVFRSDGACETDMLKAQGRGVAGSSWIYF